VRTAAQRFRLDFIPLLRERYFFAMRRDAVDDPLIRQLISVLQLPEYHDRVNELTGYDAADTGKILTLEEAFSATPGG
jgi:molybdate-binding protein